MVILKLPTWKFWKNGEKAHQPGANNNKEFHKLKKVRTGKTVRTSNILLAKLIWPHQINLTVYGLVYFSFIGSVNGYNNISQYKTYN